VNMYLFAGKIKIKMKCFFSHFNCEILYLTLRVLCRKDLSQSGYMDCKIVAIEEEDFYFVRWNARIIVNTLKFNRN
jgi:hypothetical protein